jgi:hypothetical protein
MDTPPTLSHQPAKYRQVSMDFPTYLVTPASKVSPGVDGHSTYLVTPASKVSPGVDGHSHLPCHTSQQSIVRCRWTSPPTLSHQPAKYRQVSMDILTYLVTPASKVSPGCPFVHGHPHLPCHTWHQNIARYRWTSPPTLSHQPAKYRQVWMDIPTYLVTPASKVSPGCPWTSPPTLSHLASKYR